MLCYDHGGDIYDGSAIRLDFSVNTNPLGLAPRVVAAVQDGAAEDGRYPDPHCRALRHALAEHHCVAPERILCGCGASDLILRICAWRRPRRVAVAEPTFSEYARCAALFGAQIVQLPLRRENSFAPDEAFFTQMHSGGADLVFLCQPNNPTGRLWDDDLLARLADLCEQQGTYLVVDECFLDFTRGTSALRRQEDHPHLLILQAFTKFYAMAGLRLGYLICPDGALADEIAAQGALWSVSAPAQRAGLAALEERGWQERTLRLVERERRRLTRELTNLGVTVYPSQANFLLCRAQRDVFTPLRRRGILVRRCDTFAGLDETYFRIGIKTEAENRVLVENLQEVLHG